MSDDGFSDFILFCLWLSKREKEIQEDILSLVIYSFFPTSHRHFMPSSNCYLLQAPYIILKDGKPQYIYSGSNSEYLMTPYLVDKHDDYKFPICLWSDDDIMFKWPLPWVTAASVEIDKDYPVFFRIKPVKKQENNSSDFLRMAHLLFFKKPPKHPHSPAVVTNFLDENEIGTCVSQIDWVPFISPVFGDSFKHEYFKKFQEDKWPRTLIQNIDEMLLDYVMAIRKPEQHSETGDLRFRISFSVLEVELARSLTEIQRRCYRVLKAIIKNDFSYNLPNIEQFPSYYLKTLMFWFCENMEEESWEIQNLGSQFLKLLDSVIESLDKKKLPHYFVPSHDLLYDKSPTAISSWRKRLTLIRSEPFKAFANFWQKYEIYDATEKWGNDIFENIRKVCITDTLIPRPMHYDWLCYCMETIKYSTAKYLLSLYCLQDFLSFVHINPIERLSLPQFHSKEHFIWMHYRKFMSDFIDAPDSYSEWWNSIAEITHHMVSKYGDKVPDPNFFSKETAEKFYLTSCYIDPYVFLSKFIKYANFLRAEKRFEEAVEVLMIVFQTKPSNHSCYFNAITSEVLDITLKLTLALQGENINRQGYFACHILTCCYIQAGVYSEVCIPAFIDLVNSVNSYMSPDLCALLENVEHKKLLFGFQLILSGQLLAAFHWFANISHEGLIKNNILPYNIRFTAMLFILSRKIAACSI